MDAFTLIDQYAAGVEQVAHSVAGVSEAQLDARPIAGQWSIRQVICHLADFELVYADRMKRVLAEDAPTLFGGDPDAWAARLAYARRDLATELELISAVRRQMAAILTSLADSDFQRVGIHSEDGPLMLAQLLERITNHVPHHVRFIEAKRRALGV